MKKSKTLFLTQAAAIAALYVVLTMLANLFGLASSTIQVRFSESLTILPIFMPAAIPGLVIGCFLSNIFTGCLLPDIIFGSIATLIGAIGTRAVRKHPYLAPIPPIIANSVIVPFILLYVYDLHPLWLSFITVTAGELISCGILGTLLLITLKKYPISGFQD